jgi:hypothetical protein
MRSRICDWIVGHSRLTFVTDMALVVVAGLLAVGVSGFPAGLGAIGASRAPRLYV